MSGMLFFSFSMLQLLTNTNRSYSSFRRSRFNWPSEIPDPYDDEPSVPPSPMFFTPPLPRSKSGSKSTKNSADLSNNREELTHIRTIRVFEATKPDDWSFASLFQHKAPTL